MSIKVVLDMNNDNLLISTSILTAIWGEKKYDHVDLILQFVKYIIAKNFHIGDEISKENILEGLSVDFALPNFPPNVLEAILRRLSTKKIAILLKKTYNNYFLTADLAGFQQEFEQRKLLAQQQTEIVLKALADYINENTTKIKADEKIARNYLINFFNDNGIITVSNISLLKSITAKNGNENFLVARFILDNFELKNQLFNAIRGISYGFILSKSIYIDNQSMYTKKKLENLEVYFDTTFLLYALGFKTDYQKKAAKSLIDLLRTNKASLFCFSHNYIEITDILEAYKYRISVGQRMFSNTLEYFDENEYDEFGIERVIASLKDKLEELGISVKNSPDFSYNDQLSQKEKGKYIDWVGLKAHLKDKIGGYNKNDHEKAIDNDMDSITSISLFRRGESAKLLENCIAIFVTTNIDLVRESTFYLSKFSPKDSIPFLITDVDLCMQVWTKYSFYDESIPNSILIENARAALEPTFNIIEKFNKTVEQIEKEGGVTKETSDMLQMEHYIHREVMLQSRGDPDLITPQTVKRMENLLKIKISEEVHSDNKKLQNENRKLKENNEHLLQEIFKKCKEEADDKVKTSIKRLKLFYYGIYCISFLFFLIVTILSGIKEGFTWITIGSLILAVVSLILSFYDIKEKAYKRIEKKSKSWFKIYYSRMVEQNCTIINSLQNE
jgi:hypothetical protein